MAIDGNANLPLDHPKRYELRVSFGPAILVPEVNALINWDDVPDKRFPLDRLNEDAQWKRDYLDAMESLNGL